MRAALMVLLLAAGGSAQLIVDPSRMSTEMRSFVPLPGEKALKCDLTPMRPELNFSFRFQTGYQVRVPLRQYSGAGHTWAVLLRVTPEGDKAPTFFLELMRLPTIEPNRRGIADFGGIYLVGEGRYRVDWKLVDDSGRVCRKNWTVEARRSGNERLIEPAMPPGAIAEISLRGARRATPVASDAPPFRLTVLFHVAALSPRRNRLGGRDRLALTGALSALLERLPASSIRLVAFSLDHQKEMFRQDNFSLRAMGQLARAINETDLGTVDFKVLANRRGHIDMMAKLLNAEINDPNPSDVVVVFGPPSQFYDQVPKEAVDRPANGSPRFFFLRYRATWRVEPTISDTIGMAVSKVRGKTLYLWTPGDFAKAIDLIERQSTAAVNTQER